MDVAADREEFFKQPLFRALTHAQLLGTVLSESNLLEQGVYEAAKFQAVERMTVELIEERRDHAKV